MRTDAAKQAGGCEATWQKNLAALKARTGEPAVARLALEHQDLNSLWADGGLAVGRDFTGVPKGLLLLAYPPSRRLHSGLYQRLGAYLAGEDAGGFLRILEVGPLYGGSHPIACASARAFRGLGHRAELLDFAPFYQGYQAVKGVTRDKVTVLSSPRIC